MAELKYNTKTALEESSAEIKDMNARIDDMYEKGEQYKRTLEIRFDKLELEDSLRVTHDQMKQNFQSLENIINFHWRQLDDVKKNLRNVVTYQKYIHPLQTQQIISDNFLHLAEASKDEGFVQFQRAKFQNCLVGINDLIDVGKKRHDIDSEVTL